MSRLSRRRWSGSSLSSNFSTILVAGHLLSMGSTRLFGKLQAELHDLVADVKVPRLPLGRLLGVHHLDDVLAGRPVGLGSGDDGSQTLDGGGRLQLQILRRNRFLTDLVAAM